MARGDEMKGLMKKGFVFSLDIAIAVLVTLLIMAAAHRNIVNAEKNSLPNAQMAAVGSDIAALLDHKGVLQTLDEEKIESGMNDLMPQNYDMLLKVAVDDGTVLYAGDSVPAEQFVSSGKRFFTIKDQASIEHYGYASYWIWAR
ncbi:hypothetical protein COV19_04985 [Candidatus Woesearchaeota archaeon CG10_big_fil_rev_8_21_14_0_10_44_13]|nr:MAG: hypothetical protein COV19_04985 [Candidatus Woesearchaeota archaeon CG10_big_fil_rev_8_21_14_0_10_44_13]